MDSAGVVGYLDHTLSDAAGVYIGLPVLKVFSEQYGHLLASDVVGNGIADWEKFLTGNDIP